ncbi:WD_REPEATS_REGION domain-containing protein, partial [Mortierella sp. 14UC]
MAKANLQARDEDLHPLIDSVQDFLDSDRQVMLILGDSGAGKSTFNRHLEHQLWTNYTNGDPIPLFINLPAIDRPDLDMVTKQLQVENLNEYQIQEMRQTRQFILICDGYDESQLTINLHKTNRLNQLEGWHTKMIITCRTQFLGPVYRDRFVPQPKDRYKGARLDLFQEAVIAPFSKEQVQAYVARYVPLEPRPWITEDYMRMLTTIPNLMDMVKNPFLLTLTLEALPGVTRSHQELSTINITRVQLYDHFVNEWLGVNMRRLQDSTMTDDERQMLGHMVEKGFISLGVDYSKRLALAIFDEHDGNPVVTYIHLDHRDTWRVDFFGPQADVRFLRESSPLTRTGCLFRFIHRSILEYFFSRIVFDPSTQRDHDEFGPQTDCDSSVVQSLDPNGPFFKRNLVAEPSIIQFLSDRVNLNSCFEQQLLSIVNQSKTDSRVAIASANAITILVRAGIRFNGADLCNIRVPGADISGGQFDCAQLQGADLRGANLARSWLRQANFSGAQMEDVRFGELPYLTTTSAVSACAYSPDGNFLALVLEDGSVSIYDAATWSELYIIKLAGRVLCMAFSPNSRQFVTGGTDGRARLWDCSSGKTLSVMQGHTGDLRSVAFSSCGKRFASTSNETVRIWSAEKGAVLLVLKGHTKRIAAVKYSPDGLQLASGSWDGTIRFWNAESGEPGAVWFAPLGAVLCLAYSSDGEWIITGHDEGDVQLWSVVPGEPCSVLHGHTKAITGVAFSPSGLFAVSSSEDSTVRLWDVLSGISISVLTGHSGGVKDVSFSPDGLLIASGDGDHVVRLWDVKISGVALGLEGFSDNVLAMRYTEDGRHILTFSKNRALGRRDAMRGTAETEICCDIEQPRSVTFSPNATTLATGSDDGTIALWNSRTGAPGPRLSGDGGPVYRMATSPCGRWVVFVGSRHVIRLWDSHDSKLEDITNVPFHKTIPQFTLSPSGLYFATSCYRNIIRVYTREGKEPRKVVRLKTGEAQVLAFSSRDQQLAIGTSTGLIHLWGLSLERPLEALFAGTQEVSCISYSHCGRWLAAGSDDGSIRLWLSRLVGPDMEAKESRSCLLSLVQGLQVRVEEITWNPQALQEFATRSTDHSIRVWRVSQSEEMTLVELVWGSNVGQLLVSGVEFEDAVGLGKVNRDLLLQRGAGLQDWPLSDDNGPITEDKGDEKWLVEDMWEVGSNLSEEDDKERKDMLADGNLSDERITWRDWRIIDIDEEEDARSREKEEDARSREKEKVPKVDLVVETMK